MTKQLPQWASEKIKEGMQEFLAIATEYGQFDISFKPLRFDDDIGFYATVSWSPFARPDIINQVEYAVHFNFTQLFTSADESVDVWQLVFEDSGVELNGQLFYMELFRHLDTKVASLIKAP
jgi:hypothetical protein